MNEKLSKNQNINIRSKYVLNEPFYHQLLPYRAPPTFPKVRKANNESDSNAGGYTSIYKNWPQHQAETTNIDDEIDRFYLPGCSSHSGDEENDGAFLIHRSSQLSPSLDDGPRQHERPHNSGSSSSAQPHHHSHLSRRSNDRSSEIEEQHQEYVENRVRKYLHEAEKQTSDLLALTRVNTNCHLEEKDDKAKHIRQRLFLRKNSPFSATQSLVATRLEEKLYATSPIDLLIQKNRTRCQYSNLPEIRKLNQLNISAERNRKVGQISENRICAVPNMGEVGISKDLQRSIRGKSANAIGAALYADSMQKIKNSRNVHEANHECIAKYQRSGNEEYDEEVSSYMAHQSRASSECRTIRTTHIEMMDDRAIDHLNQNVTNSLEACRNQLKNFAHTTSDMYSASR